MRVYNLNQGSLTYIIISFNAGITEWVRKQIVKLGGVTGSNPRCGKFGKNINIAKWVNGKRFPVWRGSGCGGSGLSTGCGKRSSDQKDPDRYIGKLH